MVEWIKVHSGKLDDLQIQSLGPTWWKEITNFLADKRAQWVKVLAIKYNDLNLKNTLSQVIFCICACACTHTNIKKLKRELSPPVVVSPPYTYCGMFLCAYMHILIKKINKN